MTDPVVKASLLWGAIGALSFLVLAQAYELQGDPPVGLAGKLALALLVGGAAAGLSYGGERLLSPEEPDS